jgi:hypothetical protein
MMNAAYRAAGMLRQRVAAQQLKDHLPPQTSGCTAGMHLLSTSLYYNFGIIAKLGYCACIAAKLFA